MNTRLYSPTLYRSPIVSPGKPAHAVVAHEGGTPETDRPRRATGPRSRVWYADEPGSACRSPPVGRQHSRRFQALKLLKSRSGSERRAILGARIPAAGGLDKQTADEPGVRAGH
jgi:hypothetical protein